MNKRRTRLLILFSAICLFGLLAIQVFWILRSAHIKEEAFNHRVRMVLCKATDAMCSDKETCSSFSNCCTRKIDTHGSCIVELDEKKKVMIDSILQYYMKLYDLKIDYKFEIAHDEHGAGPTGKDQIIQRFDEKVLPGNYHLSLQLPGKEKFIASEVTPIFVISILLILFVISFFFLTIKGLEKEQAILRRNTEFMNNIIHELNTPIASISLAGSRLMKDSGNLAEEKRKQLISIMVDENDKLKKQVQKALSLTSIEGSEAVISKEKADLNLILGELVNSFRIQVEDRNGTLSFRHDANALFVYADQLHLSNMFSALLENAMKYSGDQLEISVRTKRKGNEAEIIISDKGIGISEKDQKMIFEKYFRVGSGDLQGVRGFGLGLSYVQRVIEEHSGTINVSSKPGEGSTFTVTLPLINHGG